ncbi:MAG: GNAT family N-acetyltransferase [Aristaeellaceae bacterium]
MAGLVIRPYEERDWQAIEAIHDAARMQELTLAGLADAFIPLAQAAVSEGLFDYTVEVAEQAGQVVGFVAYTPEELAWLYVAPQWMRQGIGRALVRHVLGRCDGTVTLEVLTGNAPARRLYEHCGFRLTETVSGRMPGNESFPVTVWCMACEAPIYTTADGYTLRLARHGDAEAYYHQNFNPLDAEMARLTGCKADFTHDEVVSFFHQCVDAQDRRDFLIIAPDGRIIGESVINDIDHAARCANYRVAIFHSQDRERGIGAWAIRQTRDYAFSVLNLHRLELDVFSFNPRAIRAYERAGFRHEGIRRQAIPDGAGWADDILMGMTESDWYPSK